jgi:hypothetical protein
VNDWLGEIGVVVAVYVGTATSGLEDGEGVMVAVGEGGIAVAVGVRDSARVGDGAGEAGEG